MTFDSVTNDMFPRKESDLNVAISPLQLADVDQYFGLLTSSINTAVGYSDVEKLRLTIHKDAEYYRQKLMDPNALLFVAKNGDRVIGVVDGEISVDKNTGERYADILWVGVEHQVQGRKISRALGLAVEARCRELGVNSACTFIKDENLASIQAARGNDFLVDTRKPFQNGGKYYTKSL